MYEIHRILVPTDFSSHAEAALRLAVLIGSPFRAEITLLHVDEFPVSSLGALEVQGEEIARFRGKERQEIEARLGVLRDALSDRPVTFRTQVREGRAYKVIVEESERQEFDLIVIATRGHTSLSTALIGSTAERVVRLSRQPVLSIQEAPRQGGKISSILCPTDLSPAGNVALPYALSFARQNGATLYIQYISELNHPEPEAEVRKRIPNLEDHHPQAASVRVEWIFDRDVEPSNSIIRFADDRDVGLIVMSTHGRKGLRRVYIGNNTAEVVRQSTRPVLTVTHPFHRRIFSRPVTQHTESPLHSAEEI
jgi:nucleotide-binding universal stress UspA family protein